VIKSDATCADAGNPNQILDATTVLDCEKAANKVGVKLFQTCPTGSHDNCFIYFPYPDATKDTCTTEDNNNGCIVYRALEGGRDIDVCATNTTNACDVNADCNDDDGSYTCTCKDGWTGDGFYCSGGYEVFKAGATCTDAGTPKNILDATTRLDCEKAANKEGVKLFQTCPTGDPDSCFLYTPEDPTKDTCTTEYNNNGCVVYRALEGGTGGAA